MAGSDLKAKYLTATGTVVSGPARLNAIHYHSAGSTGSVVLRDGGASGTTVFTLDFHANSTGDLTIPQEGVRFNTDIHATFTNVTSMTFFYK
jgi:hypothetical protein